MERIVTEIERHICGNGFTVKGARIGNESEFDIVISGPCGTIPITYLIECRDRTKKESGVWIEQLIGRKELNKFHEVIAVSTSGFGKPAIKKAKAGGIILRTVERATDITSDFKLAKFSIKGCQVEVNNTFEMTRDAIGAFVLPEGVKSAEAKHPEETHFIPFKSYVHWAITQPEGLDWNAAAVGKYLVKYTITEPLDIRFGGLVVRSKTIKGIARIRIEVFPCQALQVAVYSENGRVIGQKVDYKAFTPSGEFACATIQVPDGDDLTLKSESWHSIPVGHRQFNHHFYPITFFAELENAEDKAP